MKHKLLINPIFCLLICLPFSAFCNLPEKPIVAVITSYNNAKWATKCLDSVFAQVYDNFRVIYIDDCSSDSTGDIVEQYIQEHSLSNKVTLIRNERREKKLFNIYNAYHSIDDWDIVIQIDGDDWLAHKQVFNKINKIYSESEIWLSYGQFKNSTGSRGYAQGVPQKIIKGNAFRKWKWVYMPLRTFYAWLFKRIKTQDLLTNVADFKGQFYPYSNDLAIMYPMIEMARNHFKFVSEFLYIRNRNNPISNMNMGWLKPIRPKLYKEVTGKQRYQPLKEPVTGTLEQLNNARADSVIIATDLLQTTSLLNSMGYHVTNIENVYVLCQTTQEDRENLAQLKNQYPAVTFIDLGTIESAQERNELIRELFSSLNDYVLFGNDSFIFNDDLDCNQCIKDLVQTYAYGVYINVYRENGRFTESKENKKIPCQRIKNNIYAWKFRNNNALFNRLAMSLHRKRNLVACLGEAPINSINDLINRWKNKKLAGESIGLFFKKQKLVEQT